MVDANKNEECGENGMTWRENINLFYNETTATTINTYEKHAI